jgi:Occluded RNA-recognition motif
MTRLKEPQGSAKLGLDTPRNRDETRIQKLVPGKAIGIIGIPDTVNETRLRSIFPEGLVILKVEMKPENKGAIVEFETEAVCHK